MKFAQWSLAVISAVLCSFVPLLLLISCFYFRTQTCGIFFEDMPQMMWSYTVNSASEACWFWPCAYFARMYTMCNTQTHTCIEAHPPEQGTGLTGKWCWFLPPMKVFSIGPSILCSCFQIVFSEGPPIIAGPLVLSYFASAPAVKQN